MIDQGVARTKLENLLADKDGQIAELALRLDLLDAAIWDERFLQYQETKARLQRLGFDVSKFRPAPRPGPAEQRSEHHVYETDDLEELLAAAKESPLDRLAREHLVDEEPVPEPAPLIRRYFKTELHVR